MWLCALLSDLSRYDEERFLLFFHKLTAHLAGLGWIGKSCMLITPEAGPRVRWITILTDAPLSVTGTPMDERCGSCTECVDICPVSSFTGMSFHEDEPRETRYDARDVKNILMLVMSGGFVDCAFNCPHGIK
jgi:ferredoxin